MPGGGSAAFEAALGRAEVGGVEEVAAVRAEGGVAGPEARFCSRWAVAPPGCGHGTQRRLPPREAAAGPGGRACGGGGHDSEPLRDQLPSPGGVG